MSKITLDNLSNNLKEYLENAGSLDPSIYQEKTDETLITEDKTIVGAINELFQNANSGKELIANAIGEPLSKDDTFSAMSNDINGLLSTFKTNMMNNGVTVNGSDKFKALIDKIATMVEEGEGKGIQFAEGECNISNIGDIKQFAYMTNNKVSESYRYGSITLDFVPQFVYFRIFYVYYVYSVPMKYITHVIYDPLENNCLTIINSDMGAGDGSIYINSVEATIDHFVPIIEDNTYYYPVLEDDGKSTIEYSISDSYWYAFGVGEEDTTLRDSLASILEDEGVSVTEEDDMASLITKVNEEFDKQVVPEGDAVASDVLSGKTFMNNSGELLTGNVTKMSEYTQITSGKVNNNGAAVFISIPPGAYTTPSVLGTPEIFLTYADLDANLVPENIVSGKSICGITGTAKTVPTIVSGTSNTIYTSEVKTYSSGIYSDSSNTWSASWYINTSDFDQLYMNYSNIKNVSITFQYMCETGNIRAYCSNVILKKGYSTIATLCTSNCYIQNGRYWYNNVDPITVTLDQLNGATVQLSGAYCTSQPTYIVQVRFIIRGNIQ